MDEHAKRAANGVITVIAEDESLKRHPAQGRSYGPAHLRETLTAIIAAEYAGVINENDQLKADFEVTVETGLQYKEALEECAAAIKEIYASKSHLFEKEITGDKTEEATIRRGLAIVKGHKALYNAEALLAPKTPEEK